MGSASGTPRSSGTQRPSGMATSFTAQSTYTRQSPGRPSAARAFASAEPMIAHGHRAGQVADVVDHQPHDYHDAQRAENRAHEPRARRSRTGGAGCHEEAEFAQTSEMSAGPAEDLKAQHEDRDAERARAEAPRQRIAQDSPHWKDQRENIDPRVLFRRCSAPAPATSQSRSAGNNRRS